MSRKNLKLISLVLSLMLIFIGLAGCKADKSNESDNMGKDNNSIVENSDQKRLVFH